MADVQEVSQKRVLSRGEGGKRTKSDLKRDSTELYEMKYGERERIRKQQRERRKQMLKDMGYKEINGKLYPIN